MEIGRDLFGRQYANIARQIAIEASDERRRTPRLIGIEMHDLPQGVYARIGAAARHCADFFTGQFLERRLQSALHGRLPRLHLPPRIRRPHIIDCQTYAHMCS